MNNYFNVQSPNFGMAYGVSDLKALRKSLNNMSAPELNKLAQKMQAAKEKLEDTAFADVKTFVTGDGSIKHECIIRTPQFSEDGTIRYVFESSYEHSELPDAVNDALTQEQAKQELENAMNKFVIDDMAHQVSDINAFRIALNKMSVPEMNILAQEMKIAEEKLQDTAFADVKTFVSDDGSIKHVCIKRKPQLSEDGAIRYVSDGNHEHPKLTDAVNDALTHEKAAQELEDAMNKFNFLA